MIFIFARDYEGAYYSQYENINKLMNSLENDIPIDDYDFLKKYYKDGKLDKKKFTDAVNTEAIYVIEGKKIKFKPETIIETITPVIED